MKKLMGVLALGLVFAGCGVGPDQDPLPISSREGALDNGGYTTRDVCTACGCVASDVACDCGMPPSQKKLDCISNGGPVTNPTLGSAASAGATLSGASGSISTTMLPGTKVPFCLPGEVVHCTLGPPPVCTCVPSTTGGGVFKQ